MKQHLRVVRLALFLLIRLVQLLDNRRLEVVAQQAVKVTKRQSNCEGVD